MATEVSENEILECLLKNIEESIPIDFDERKIEWGKSLEGMPVFTVREIEDHKKGSGENGVTIEKTSERGLQFKNERYLNADTIQTMQAKDLFKFKGVCHVSIKKEKRFVEVHLCRKSSKVISSHCSCPAGNSGYCNHIMAMLYEIADYSLHSFKSVPLELACTSNIRQWGVPGEKYCRKTPLIETIIQKRGKSRRITCTLYDPRRNKNPTVLRKSAIDLKAKLQSKDSRIGFSHCNFFMENNEGASTDFGVFPTGSTIAQQLNPVEFDIKFLVNIKKSNTWDFSVQELTNVPLKSISKNEPVIPAHWCLSSSEMEYFNEIRINIENSKQLKEDTP